jgi:hypothetical protein
VVNRCALLVPLLAAGCFDFEALSRNLDGAGMPDLAGAGDGATSLDGAPDLAGSGGGDGAIAGGCKSDDFICEGFEPPLDATYWNVVSSAGTTFLEDSSKALTGAAGHFYGQTTGGQPFAVQLQRRNFPPPSPTPLGAFYARVWVRVLAIGPTGTFMRTREDAVSMNVDLGIDSNGKLVISDGLSGGIATSPSPITLDTWHCVEWDVTGGMITALVDHAAWSLTVTNSGYADFDVGYFNDANQPTFINFDVWLDDLRVSPDGPPGC